MLSLQHENLVVKLKLLFFFVFFFELLLRLELSSSFVVLRETLVSPKLQKHTPEPVMKSAVDQHQQVFYNFYGLSCR